MFDTSLTLSQVTLASCESEKLHLSGRIQGHGALIVVSDSDRLITHASANCESVIGCPVSLLLGTSLASQAFYTPDFEEAFALPLNEQMFIANVVTFHGAHLDVTFIRNAGSVLIEWEPAHTSLLPIAIHQMHRTMVRAPSHKDDINVYHNTLIGHIRQITGMDRVMVYRFREDWAGEVVAESFAGDRGSYMDLRFPATDIPEIARKLYVQNPYRMIPDIAAPVFPVWSTGGEPPDLTWSDLRSVSPMHLEYMRNMGVKASFSLPIVITGKLWGLVACHHYDGPNLLGQDQRHACVTLVTAYSLGLANYLASAHLQALDSMDRRIQVSIQPLVGVSNPLDSLAASGMALAGLVNAEGFAMAIDEEAAISGSGPDLAGLAVIDDWFLNHHDDASATLERMNDVFTGYPEVGPSSCGVLAVKIWTAGRGWLRFYWFRQAEIQHITWAGNPDKPQAENAAATHLSPRRSFEKWVETRTGYCREWTADEKLIAAKFRSTVGRML